MTECKPVGIQCLAALAAIVIRFRSLEPAIEAGGVI